MFKIRNYLCAISTHILFKEDITLFNEYKKELYSNWMYSECILNLYVLKPHFLCDNKTATSLKNQN